MRFPNDRHHTSLFNKQNLLDSMNEAGINSTTIRQLATHVRITGMQQALQP